MAKLLYKEESYIIQGVAYDIYKKFRNRHKEKVYQEAFYWGLKEKGLKIEREKRINVYYKKRKVGTYTPDIIVNDRIFIELKTKSKVCENDIKQFWYYLKVSGYKIGYLINFGKIDGVQIIRRISPRK